MFPFNIFRRPAIDPNFGSGNRLRLKSEYSAHVLLLANLDKTVTGEDLKIKFNSLYENFEVKSSWCHNEIINEFNFKSDRLGPSSFIAPIEDELVSRMNVYLSSFPSIKASLVIGKSNIINAYVTKTGTLRYEIQIDIGLIVYLYLLSISLIISPKGLSNHVTKPNEYWCKIVFKDLYPYLQVLKMSPFSIFFPDDDWKILLCHSLVTKSLDYILIHELSHITCGHIELIQNSAVKNKVLSTAEYHLIESQADDKATFFAKTKWIFRIEGHSFVDGPILIGRTGLLTSKPDSYNFISYSICLTFIALNLTSDPFRSQTLTEGNILEKLANTHHPPVSYRLNRSLALMSANEKKFIDASRLIDILSQIFHDEKIPYKSELFNALKNEVDLNRYGEILDNVGKDILLFEKEWAESIFVAIPFGMVNKPKGFWGSNG